MLRDLTHKGRSLNFGHVTKVSIELEMSSLSATAGVDSRPGAYVTTGKSL